MAVKKQAVGGQPAQAVAKILTGKERPPAPLSVMTSARTTSDSNADMEMKRLAAHKKTIMCKFFELGQCTRGDRCTFAHGSEQLRQAPDFSKTRLCADFIEYGNCHFGRKCSFAHGKRELRPGSAAKLGRPGQLLGSGCMGRGGRGMVSPGPVSAVYMNSLHESAAMKLLFDATARSSFSTGAESLKSAEADDSFGCADSMSRQVTWEGIESSSAGFVRDVSLSSDPRDGQREEEQPLRRCRSLPFLKLRA